MSTSAATLLVFVSDKLACVKIQGRANFSSSMDFKALIQELVAKQFTCFVLDLSNCVLMDSTFLGVLAGFGLKMNSGQNGNTNGQMIELMNPNPRIAELLENLGVIHLFHVVTGPVLEMSEGNHAPAPAPSLQPSREEVVSNCLEAHKILMAIDPANVPKFKEVAEFLANDLKKTQSRPVTPTGPAGFMKFTIVLIYGLLFSISFLIFALLWHLQISNVYFVCRDQGAIGDFLPPFVHGGESGDFFIKPPQIVYAIWAVYVALALLAPGVGSWLLFRLYQRALKKEWT